MSEWMPIDTAPEDGTMVEVMSDNRCDLPTLVVNASYHPEAGWCICELRNAIAWRPIQ